MIFLQSIAKLNNLAKSSIRVLVPTMGALHEGHASLIRRARQIAGEQGEVMVSIFVNPTQFDRAEDLASYPRHMKDDLELCKKEGADYVFAPQPDDVYYQNRSLSISENALSRRLCGATRPGHFDGVCLIVTKLFLITQASHAVFGEKDYQQLAIIRRLVRDLNLPVTVIPVPTVREASGLAMSSRNELLSDELRTQAATIHSALQSAALLHARGEHSSSVLLHQVKERIDSLPCSPKIDYLEIVDTETLCPLHELQGQHAIIAIAVFFGEVRLIDNQLLDLG